MAYDSKSGREIRGCSTPRNARKLSGQQHRTYDDPVEHTASGICKATPTTDHRDRGRLCPCSQTNDVRSLYDTVCVLGRTATNHPMGIQSECRELGEGTVETEDATQHEQGFCESQQANQNECQNEHPFNRNHDHCQIHDQSHDRIPPSIVTIVIVIVIEYPQHSQRRH